MTDNDCKSESDFDTTHSSATRHTQCPGQVPAYLAERDQCFLDNGLAVDYSACTTGDNEDAFSCDVSTNCEDTFTCLAELEEKYQDQICGMENGRERECNVVDAAIRCAADPNYFPGCTCPALVDEDVDADRSCAECVYSGGVLFGDDCADGCLVCGFTIGAPAGTNFKVAHRCLVCEDEDYEVVPAHGDCSGTCRPASQATGGVQCTFPCEDICDKEDTECYGDGCDNGVTCTDVQSCWRCLENDCTYDTTTGTCAPYGAFQMQKSLSSGRFVEFSPPLPRISKKVDYKPSRVRNLPQKMIQNKDIITDTDDCTDLNDYLVDRNSCFATVFPQGNFDCVGDSGYSCSSQECQQAFNDCFYGEELNHHGEVCHFREGRDEECNAAEFAIACEAGFFDFFLSDCACPELDTELIDPDNTCLECLYFEGARFGDDCADGCAVCGFDPTSGNSDPDRCYVCESDDEEVVPVRNDCTGTCTPRSQIGPDDGLRCFPPCFGICSDEDGDGEPDDGDSDCPSCLVEHQALFTDDCFRGSDTSGACAVCLGSNAESHCLICEDPSLVVDVSTARCTGRCVDIADATRPQSLQECYADILCLEECFLDDEDTEGDDEDDVGVDCPRCIYENGGGSDDLCFQGDQDHGRCTACGFGADRGDANHCIACDGDFELDVQNDDCSGVCVPQNQAIHPIWAAEGCPGPCHEQCYYAVSGLRLQERCGSCLREAGYHFGLDCFEGSGDPSSLSYPPRYDQSLGVSRSEYCNYFAANPGPCFVCGTDTTAKPADSSNNCLACEDPYQLSVKNPLTATGICVPAICVDVPLERSSVRFDCVSVCLDAFDGDSGSGGGAQEDDEDTDAVKDPDEFDDVCDSMIEDILEQCSEELSSGLTCFDATPSTECCRLLSIAVVKNCQLGLAQLNDAACSFRPTGSQLKAKCTSNVQLQSKTAKTTVNGWTASTLNSAAALVSVKRAFANLLGVLQSQIFIKSFRDVGTKQGGVEIEVEVIAEEEELQDIQTDLGDGTALVTELNTQVSAAQTEFGVTIDTPTSASLTEVSNSTSSVVDEDVTLEVCEYRYSDTACGTELSVNCFDTNGQTCDAVLEGVLGQTYDLICDGSYTGHDACCQTDGSTAIQSLKTTCGPVQATPTTYSICSSIFSDDSCTTSVADQICIEYEQDCDSLLELQATNLQELCGSFTTFGECCSTAVGGSVFITCSESAGAAVTFMMALIFPLLVSLFMK